MTTAPPYMTAWIPSAPWTSRAAERWEFFGQAAEDGPADAAAVILFLGWAARGGRSPLWAGYEFPPLMLARAALCWVWLWPPDGEEAP